MDSMTTNRTRQSLAYAGAVHHEGQILHAYYQLDDRQTPLGDAQLYAQPLVACEPGAVYSFEVSDGGRAVVKSSAVRAGTFPDAAAVAEWTARDHAILMAEQAFTSVFPQAAFRCVDPIREAYRRLDPMRRGVLLAQIVRYLDEPL